MKKLIFTAFALVLLLSCENEQVIPFVPQLPQNVNLDVNNDGVDDFVISYRVFETENEPSSKGMIMGSIHPLRKNQLLYHREGGYLFKSYNSQIQHFPKAPEKWTSIGADLIKIERTYDAWDSKWSVLSNKADQYVLGYKFVSQRISYIGYLLLDFDQRTGEVIVLDNRSAYNEDLGIEIPKY